MVNECEMYLNTAAKKLHVARPKLIEAMSDDYGSLSEVSALHGMAQSVGLVEFHKKKKNRYLS